MILIVSDQKDARPAGFLCTVAMATTFLCCPYRASYKLSYDTLESQVLHQCDHEEQFENRVWSFLSDVAANLKTIRQLSPATLSCNVRKVMYETALTFHLEPLPKQLASLWESLHTIRFDFVTIATMLGP